MNHSQHKEFLIIEDIDIIWTMDKIVVVKVVDILLMVKFNIIPINKAYIISKTTSIILSQIAQSKASKYR